MIAALENHLWQSTVFACVAALLTMGMRRNRAAVRHTLWLTASVKFLVPFSLLMSLGSHVEWRTAPIVAHLQFAALEQINEPFAMPIPPPLRLAPMSETSSRIPVILFGVWLFGFAASGIAWWLRWKRMSAALGASTPLPMRLPIPVMSSPEQLEPGVFGIRKPVLLLPVGITERLTPVQFEAIVAHELTHARRHDNLAAAIHMVVETLFWFHPFVWWIEARLVEERERACDEEVLRMGSDPQDYAEGILSVVKFYLESPLACVSGVTGSNLKKRVEAIMINRNANNLSFGRKLLLVIAAMLALTGPFVIGVLRAPMTQAQTASAPKSGSVARAESLLPSSPRFEVASIRVSSPTEPHPGRLGAVQIETSPGRLTARNATMSELIKGAYTLEDYQVSGGPAWIANPGFDVEAKGPDGANRDQLLLRLRALLADRFELSVHWEPKELLVYALVVARGGAKLHPAKPFDATVPHGSRMHITDLRSLATYLSRLGSWPAQPGRPVIDKTGLTGDFDLDLDLSKVIAALPQSGVPTTNEGMYEATVNFVQEEFGLKLESQKAQVDVLVIDHVERPSEN